MKITNLTNLRKNLFEEFENCIKYNDTLEVNTKDGTAYIISENEYNGLLETLYLCSIPGKKEKLMQGMTADTSEFEEIDLNELV